MKPRGLDYLMSLAAPPALKNWEGFVDSCRTERTKVQDQYEKEEKPASEQRKDFFHWLWHAVDPETGRKGYDLNELYGELELLIVAGSDTTSIVMSAMLFYLARNPEIQVKLAEEVRSVFAKPEDIVGGAQLQSCKYLKAFIQEACRMNAPVPAEPARTVMAGGTHVDGQYFPEGLKVSIGMYCLSYNPEIYPEPFKFRPERWIVDEKNPKSAAEVERAESGFCAFSFGSRGCEYPPSSHKTINILLTFHRCRQEPRLVGNERDYGEAGAPLRGQAGPEEREPWWWRSGQGGRSPRAQPVPTLRSLCCFEARSRCAVPRKVMSRWWTGSSIGVAVGIPIGRRLPWITSP